MPRFLAQPMDWKRLGCDILMCLEKKQDPNGAYAAVIPKFISQLIQLESPVINGDGSYSRDFTYIDNVIQANLLSMTAPQEAVNTVYNVAFGDRNTLNDLMRYLKELLSVYNPAIEDVAVVYGVKRTGDIPHSHASISKVQKALQYHPQYSLQQGLKEAIQWYWEDLK